MGKIKVLLADDDKDILDYLKIEMGEKYDLITAENGTEALALAEAESPDVIVLDIIMPGMNGLDVCMKLRGDERFKETPILMVTGVTEGSDLPDGFWRIAANSDAFITKPVTSGELIERIDDIIRTKILKLDGSNPHGRTGYL